MIDIHTHIIPYVDDGSKTTEDSLKILEEEIRQGVTDVICTPHFRRGMFEKSLEETEREFKIFKKEVEKAKLNINIYLGQEIYIHGMSSFGRYIDNNYIRPLNNTNFYLLEFSYFDEIDITEIAYNIHLSKRKVIIAHIERYTYLTIDDARELKNIGAYIQVNASSVLGKHGFIIKRKVSKLLKEGLVDFIASDIHSNRVNYLEKAKKYIDKKYGLEYSNKLFEENARELLLKESN